MHFKIYTVSFQIYLRMLKSWNVICWSAELITGQNSTCLLSDDACYLSQYTRHRTELPGHKEPPPHPHLFPSEIEASYT